MSSVVLTVFRGSFLTKFSFFFSCGVRHCDKTAITPLILTIGTSKCFHSTGNEILHKNKLNCDILVCNKMALTRHFIANFAKIVDFFLKNCREYRLKVKVIS